MGNSPRSDIVEDINNLLNDDYEIKEIGILDGLNPPEIELLKAKDNEESIITKMNGEKLCILSSIKVECRIQEVINNLSINKNDIILINCDEEYKNLNSNHSLLIPYKILIDFLESTQNYQLKTAIIFPVSSQIQYSSDTWKNLFPNSKFFVANPFIRTDLTMVSRSIYEFSPELIILNCFGFTLSQKYFIEKIIHVPVILPREVVMDTIINMKK